MKKKVLFIVSNLESGGVSKSIVSLLSSFDKIKYDVTLIVLSPTGLYMDMLPDNIRLIYDNRIIWLHEGLKGLKLLLLHFHFLLFVGSLIRMLISTINKGYAGLLLSKLMPCITKDEYDMIVDYGGQQMLYYMVDKLNGKQKVSFFHNDYSQWTYYYKIDKLYYPKVDKIFTISETCVKALKLYFPHENNKIEMMENIISPSLINNMANEKINEKFNTPSILTVGHINKQKGTKLAIEASDILNRRGVDFKWYFVGKIIDNWDNLIKKYELENRIIFLGLRKNPYPYMKAATIYCQPSLFEGKSIALDEAKILCKPTVVTNFTTVNDQFSDRFNASICEMTPDDLADKIQELLDDKNLREKYSLNLKNNIVDNMREVYKLYKLIDN